MKVFQAARREGEGREFELNGVILRTIPGNESPITALLDLFDDQLSVFKRSVSFIEAHLQVDDAKSSDAGSSLDRFRELLNDRNIELQTVLNDIMSWLVEEYSGRPTQPPSPSEAGRSTTGATSKEDGQTSLASV